jgi:hypothetical protein
MMQLKNSIKILCVNLKEKVLFNWLGRITGTKWLLREILKPFEDSGI